MALGPKSGIAVERIGRRRGDDRPLFMPGELCCDIERFSLHAKVQIEATDREALERLCRYIARPPIKVERLSLDPAGRVIYALRRHWRDGTSAISFDPLDFLSRLAALIPRPRAHLLTYHGILAPAAEWRDLVVPRASAKSSPSPQLSSASGPALTPNAHRPTRTSWAELMKRVFAIDVLVCPHCGGSRKLIALLTHGLVVRKIVANLDLATDLPLPVPARTPGGMLRGGLAAALRRSDRCALIDQRSANEGASLPSGWPLTMRQHRVVVVIVYQGTMQFTGSTTGGPAIA